MIEQLYNRIRLPFPDDKLEIYSDGNDDYTYVLSEYYAETCINYGQLIKIRENGNLIGKEKRIIYGDPDQADIETTETENFNSIMRERSGRLVRKTKCFSKLKRRLISALELFLFYWDFINNFRRGKSPAMLEGITTKLWNWHEFFYYKLTITN